MIKFYISSQKVVLCVNWWGKSTSLNWIDRSNSRSSEDIADYVDKYETPVKDMSVRREYGTQEAPCKLKLFISRANLDISEMCFIDVHCKAFWKGNSFFFWNYMVITDKKFR